MPEETSAASEPSHWGVSAVAESATFACGRRHYKLSASSIRPHIWGSYAKNPLSNVARRSFTRHLYRFVTTIVSLRMVSGYLLMTSVYFL